MSLALPISFREFRSDPDSAQGLASKSIPGFFREDRACVQVEEIHNDDIFFKSKKKPRVSNLRCLKCMLTAEKSS